MVQDWNELINRLNNLRPYRQNATLSINKPGIVSSVPNYKLEQGLSRIGNIGKAGGIIGTAIPFYKNIALPVANGLYQGFIMGNPDKSKALQAVLSLAGIDRYGNKVAKEKINNTNDTGVPLEILDDNQLTGGKSVQVNNKSAQVSGQPSVQVARQTASQLASQPTAQPSEQANKQANIQAINDYIQQLKGINQPYVEALQNYLNNYDRLARDNYARNRYWQGIASITGNPNWAKMANDYNPITNEANKVNTIKTLQDAQAGNVNAINEIMGNLAMAEEMGLPPEAAFANKNLLTAMTMRDRNLTNREIAQLNNAIKLQVALQNAQNRLAVQNLRNQGGITNALIYAGQYGQPAPGLNMQGAPANNQDVGLQQILQNAQKQNNR